MRFSIPGLVIWIVAALCAAAFALAADPQSYRVDLAASGDGAMDATLRASSELISLRDRAPVSPFGLIARARGENERLKTVMESYGYYQSAVTITIDGQALSNPGLADALNALPKGQNARVSINLRLGPLYHLRNVELEGAVPESAAGAFSLKSGAPAVAADVLAAGAHLQSVLQEQGYAFAKVDPPVAYEDQTLPVLDVRFKVEAGARVTIGDISLEGLVRVHEQLVRHRLTLHTGDRYNPGAIEAARRDLQSLGPFDAVSVKVGQAIDASGGVPVTFVLRERKRHLVTVNAAFSSDLGGSGGATWGDRNVFGNAETLNIAASVINLGGSDTTGVGYDTSAKFTIPEFGHRDQSVQFAVGAIKQYLVAYDQKAFTSGVTVTRKLSSVWSASAGVATSDEQIVQNGSNFNYTLVGLPVSVNYDSTHPAAPLDDPTHGMRDSLSVTPTQSLGHPNATFIITKFKFATYFDLRELGFADPGRSVLAVSGFAGDAAGAGELSLPPDQRFYAGGSGTIRGYPYQLVGPVFPTTDIPIGGTAIAAGSVEFRQRFGASWGAALFVDGGQVSARLKPVPTDLRVGIGAGVRYYTPIGPIRLDIAVPTTRDKYQVPDPNKPGMYVNSTRTYDQAFQVYIGLGQAF